MTKFQKIQKISSIIPFLSTIFVVILTMIELKRNKATKKIWCYFVLTFLVSGAVIFLINNFVMSGQYLVLNILVSGLILAVANIIFVDLQRMSAQAQSTPRKISNKGYLIIGIIGGAIALTCIIFSLAYYFKPVPHIEDANGPSNTNLATITQNEIVTSNDVYTAYRSYTSYDGPQTDIVGKLEEFDYEECSLKCEKLSGIYTLQATKSNHNRLTLDFTSQLDAGNMEIFVIVDDQVYANIPVNLEYSITLSDVAGKTVVVKIAAESAKMNVHVKRTLF